MLKSKIPNSDIILQTNIYAEDFSSDRDFYNQKLLKFSTDSVINSVIDSEIYEYIPESINEINFNLFFLRYIQDNEYEIIKDYLESGFQTQYTNSKINFGLINSDGLEISKAFNNLFETRQSNGLRETPVLLEKNLTKIQELKQKPFIVRDIIGESTLKKPTRSGIPIFYNSFTFPFWDKKERWVNDSLLYTNKSYFYNSFLLLEFYDSPFIVTQNRIQAIPIFVNNRYNITERNITKNFDYERPSFKLTNGVDGYSFFFLKNYITNEFYVRFSFWDALNGKKISLIPSSNINPNKKWLQDSDTFNQNIRYLKYILDYDTKTYKIYEYNTITNNFDTERFDFDLYELEFDLFYKNRVVPNEQPIDSRTQIKPIQLKNPLNFSIKNLYTNSYIGDSSNKYITLSQQEINNSSNFLGITKKFIETFNTYISNINTEIFGELPTKEMVLPVIDRKIKGYQVLMKSFLLKNNDDVTWNIRNIEFRDIVLSINGINISNTYYNQRQTLWNEKPSFRLSEAITTLNETNNSYNFSYDTTDFTREVLLTYLSDSLVFKKLLNLIERDRYFSLVELEDFSQSGNGNSNIETSEQLIPTFLDKCFKTLKVRYDQRHAKTNTYLGYSLNRTTGVKNFSFSEIYFYIDELTEKYIGLKTTDIDAFNEIKNMAISLLTRYMTEQQDLYGICSGLVSFINSVITPKDNQELVDKYLLFITKKNVTSFDKKIIERIINPNSLSLILDKPESELRYEPRDYVFETFIIQNGDKILLPSESNKIDFYFNIGEKIKFFITNSSEIIIRGRLRISIINNVGEIKNIVIPIKSSINTKKQNTVIKNRIIPRFRTSEPEPGSTINQLTLIK
jgi:hypothetical protein